MNTISRSRRYGLASAILISMPLVALIGCMQPVKPGETSTPSILARPKPVVKDESNPPLETNIVRVSKFFSSEPWLAFDDDGSNRVNGFRCTVYLEGAGQPLGVFGSGTIVVNMYQVDVDPHGKENITQLQEWQLPPDKAYPWRAKKRTLLGYGYGLRLRWDDRLNVGGRQVAFLVRYVRDDGRTITSTRQVLKVPVRGGIPVNTRGDVVAARDMSGQ